MSNVMKFVGVAGLMVAVITGYYGTVVSPKLKSRSGASDTLIQLREVVVNVSLGCQRKGASYINILNDEDYGGPHWLDS